MSEKKVPLIFNPTGTSVSDILATSKDERARTFPLLSHSPHLKQEDLGEMLQLHATFIHNSKGT